MSEIRRRKYIEAGSFAEKGNVIHDEPLLDHIKELQASLKAGGEVSERQYQTIKELEARVHTLTCNMPESSIALEKENFRLQAQLEDSLKAGGKVSEWQYQRIKKLEAEIARLAKLPNDFVSGTVHRKLQAKLDAVQKHYDKWMLGELNDLDCVNRIGDVLEAIGEQE